MAGPSDIISHGLGSWGSISDMVTLGLGIGAAPVVDQIGSCVVAFHNQAVCTPSFEATMCRTAFELLATLSQETQP